MNGPSEAADDESGPAERDLGNAVLANDASVQNTVAVVGVGALLVWPVASVLVALRRLLHRRLRRHA